MRSLCVYILLCFQAHAFMIYGEDDRLDFLKVSGRFSPLAASAVAIIDRDFLFPHEEGFELRLVGTLEESLGVCSEVRFSQQTVAASCSGVLIAPELVLTAGHCFAPNSEFEDEQTKCKSLDIVFNFKDDNQNFSKDEVFRCEHVFFHEKLDAAIVKLQRPALEQKHVNVNYFSPIAVGEQVITVGHPSGLPLKFDSGAQVLNHEEEFLFINSDTFQASSGSAVINQQTMELEGILVSGNPDYILSDPTDPFSCLVENRCDEFGENCLDEVAQPGEGVLSIRSMLDFILPFLKPEF